MDALAKEVSPLGTGVIVVAPSANRTFRRSGIGQLPTNRGRARLRRPGGWSTLGDKGQTARPATNQHAAPVPATPTFHSTVPANRACVGQAQLGGGSMAQGGIDIATCLEALSRRLVDAAAVAQAAVACAHAGSQREAVRIALKLDDLLGEAQTLHGAVCLLGRMDAPDGARPP